MLRTYDGNGNFQFEDLKMGFKNGKAFIQDAFLYAITSHLSEKIASESTLNVFMTIDNPTEDARNMIMATALCANGEYGQMWELLNEQKANHCPYSHRVDDVLRVYVRGCHVTAGKPCRGRAQLGS